MQFQSDITCSVQNEDYRTELAVVRRIHRGTPLRVLMVAGSGENALSIMADDRIGDVHAADGTIAQIHLAELRRTALRYLDREEQLRLFGAELLEGDRGDASTRLALYDRVRDHLPRVARAFWDERRANEIAFGIQHCGRDAVVMADIRANLRKHGFVPLEKPLNGKELPAWQAAYVEIMTPDRLRELLPDAAAAERLASDIPRLAELHFRALMRRDARLNYFLTAALEGRYADTAGEEGLPLYLQYEGQEALRRLGSRERLKLHAGGIVEQAKVLAPKVGGFDLISISNLADRMDETQLAAAIADLQACLTPGGAVLLRTIRDGPTIAAATAQHLIVDEAFNTQLADTERGPWFRTIAAGFRAPADAPREDAGHTVAGRDPAPGLAPPDAPRDGQG